MSPKACTRSLASWLYNQRRCYNTAQVQNYHPKVSAIPFAVSPEEAIQQSALKVCYHVENCPALIQAFLSKISTLYETPRPIRIEPIYFPTWLVDAEVTAKVSEHNYDSTVQTQATAQSLSTYFPEWMYDLFDLCEGFDHFPLSLPKFRFNPATTSLCSPLDEGFGLIPQSEQPITCLPYIRSPFTLPEAALLMSFEQAKIDSALRIEPASIRFPLMAPAYPILFPVYLMQWKGLDGTRGYKPYTFNIILEAHKPHGLMYMESYFHSSFNIPQINTRIWKYWSQQVLLLTHNKGWEGGAAVHKEGDMYMKLYRGFNRPRSRRMAVHLDKMATISHISKRIENWLDRQLLSRELRLASSTELKKEEIDWDDFRIRQWSPEEQSKNSKYWMMRMQTTMTRTVMKEVLGSKNSLVVTIGSSGLQAGKGEEMKQRMQAELERFERLTEESKPEWLKIAEEQDQVPKV